VYGDPDALERVIRNLIDNGLAAIQPTGRIDVQLRRLNGYVQALVADDGPGTRTPTPTHLRTLRLSRTEFDGHSTTAKPGPAQATYGRRARRVSGIPLRAAVQRQNRKRRSPS